MDEGQWPAQIGHPRMVEAGEVEGSPTVARGTAHADTLSDAIREALVLPAMEAADDLPALLEDFRDFYLITLPGAIADLDLPVNPQSLRSRRVWQRAVANQKTFLEPLVLNRALRVLEADQGLGRPGRGMTAREVAAALSAAGLDVGRGMCREALRALAAQGWLERSRDHFQLAAGARERLRLHWAPEELFGVLLGLPRTLVQRDRAIPGSRLDFIRTMLPPADLAAYMRDLRPRLAGVLEAFGTPRSLVPPGEAHRFTCLQAGALTGPDSVKLGWSRPASPAVKMLVASLGAHLGVQIGTLDQAVAALQRAIIVHLYRVYGAGRESGDHVEAFFAKRYHIHSHDTLMAWRNGPMPEKGEQERLPLNGGFVGEALQEILAFLICLNSEVVSESRIRAHVREACSSGAARGEVVALALQRLVQDGSIIRVSGRARPQGEDGYQSQVRLMTLPPEGIKKELSALRTYLVQLPGMTKAFVEGSAFSHAFTEERVVLRSQVDLAAGALRSIAEQLIEEYNRPYAEKSEAEMKALGGQAFTLLFQCHQLPIIPHED